MHRKSTKFIASRCLLSSSVLWTDILRNSGCTSITCTLQLSKLFTYYTYY